MASKAAPPSREAARSNEAAAPAPVPRRAFAKALKASIARTATPLIRAYLRFSPITLGKEAVWTRVVTPYFNWRHHAFSARTRFGARIVGDTIERIQQLIYYFGVWEPNLSSWLHGCLQPGDVFIDVGSNIGYFSLLAAARVGESGKVVAIDASPVTFELLKRNVAANRAHNVRTIHVAVSDKPATLTLYQGPSDNLGATTLVVEWAEQWHCLPAYQVAAKPLQDIVTDEEITRARIIKIDVEGAEWQVVQSLIPLLDRCRPDAEIVVEVTPAMLAAHGHSARQLLELFVAKGFKTYRIQNEYSTRAYIEFTAAERPRRVRLEEIVEQSDIILSRVDAEYL